MSVQTRADEMLAQAKKDIKSAIDNLRPLADQDEATYGANGFTVRASNAFKLSLRMLEDARDMLR